MSPRLFEIFRQEFTHNLRRPLFWVQILLMGLMAYGLANGNASIQSGDARVGGQKAWMTSEFALSQTLILMICVCYVFFIAVAAGMSMIHDDEQKIGELLHATPLTPREYVWGKFLAVFMSFVWVLAMHIGITMAFHYLLPHGANAEAFGPFALSHYLRPALVFGLPVILLFTGVSFAVGGLTRKPVLVFAFPVGVLMVGMFFLWDWSPTWLPLWANRVLQFADLTGLRWINETWLNVDKGVAFYNREPVWLDMLIIVQRLFAIALGLGAVSLLARHFARSLRGAPLPKAQRGQPFIPSATPVAAAPTPRAALATLAMQGGAPGFAAGVLEVAKVEWHELLRHPGLYLFVPMILLQTFGSEFNIGAYDTKLLLTSGTLATSMMNTLTLLISLVILFYTTESLQRERSTGFGSIYYATPLRTAALLAGKALANTVLGLVIVLACFIGCLILLAIQGRTPLDPGPFLLVWGLLLVPTFLVWTAFVSATFAATSNRYATYAVGIGTMIATGWAQSRGHMSWVWNWNLWSVTRWSDIATFEYDRLPLLLNRTMVLLLSVFLIVLTVRLFERRERDATRLMGGLRPGPMFASLLGLLPFLLPPVVAGTALQWQVHTGYEGAVQRKFEKDYWKRNVETWKDAPTPALAGVDLDVKLEPAQRGLTVKGWYDLENTSSAPMARFPITINPRWRDVQWTFGAGRCSTENRASLLIVTPPRPLAPGEKLRLGFSYHGPVTGGISKNGGYKMEYNLPSSIVLAGFASVEFVPQIGYQSGVGIEPDKNETDSREFAEDWYVGESRAGLPMADRPFDVHMRVDVPAGLMVNATGEKLSEKTRGGRSVTEWRTDHPVRIFNLVAGRWKVKTRPGVAVAYDPRHGENVDEMLDALEGARRWYGEWFAPLPWKTLRLSEFAGLATYAQAPAGNITFSENIGFLTKSEPRANAAFWITAHESAHQWWPNLAMAADGPGTELLSEGMSHFSTILLTEQVRGMEQRIAWCRQIEDRYANVRRRDSERPLIKVDGKLPAESRIIYDKGGWSFYMLHLLQGRERSLAAIREYLETFRDSRDHASLEDYLAIQRRHAADTTAFDRYVHQWFEEVVIPQYLIRSATMAKTAEGWQVRATIRNTGTGRMPVEVAAVRGERFPEKGKKASPWQTSRTTLELGAGEEATVTLRMPFQPERLVVDPDLHVMMLERQKAEVKLKEESGTPVAMR